MTDKNTLATTPHKYGQLILADSSVRKALETPEPQAIELPMYVPTRSTQTCGSECKAVSARRKGEAPDATLGGFMAVPLVGIRFGENVVSKDRIKEYCDKVCVPHILLVFDTGSEAYFVQDDTGCEGNEPVEQLLKMSGIEAMAQSPGGGISLTVGTMGGDDNFVIRHPVEWFMLPLSAIAQPVPPMLNTRRSQTIIVGNFFIQAMAMTWNASLQTISFSHLDNNGNRCSTFQFKETESEEKERSLAQLESITGPGGQGLRWNPGVSLSGEELTFAGGAGQAPILDTTLDLRFMQKVGNDTSKKYSRYGDSIINYETTNPKHISEFCLDAVVELEDGSSAHVCQPFDTGSEVNLITADGIVNGGGAPPTCMGGGTVKEIFTAVAGNEAEFKTCRSQSEARCGQGCCKTCCLSPGTTEDTKMECSVAFCTGMLSYKPQYTTLRFPLENGTQNLRGVKTHVGIAKPRCLAVPFAGVWGSWFWTQTLRQGEKTNQASTSLPYYLLSHLGATDANMANLTLRVWRTDLTPAKASTVLGKTPLTSRQRFSLTRRQPQWYKGDNNISSPFAAPVVPSAPADAPFGSADAPFGSADAPFGSADAPFGSADAPFGSADAPFGSADAPFGSADAPFGSAHAPGVASSNGSDATTSVRAGDTVLNINLSNRSVNNIASDTSKISPENKYDSGNSEYEDNAASESTPASLSPPIQSAKQTPQGGHINVVLVVCGIVAFIFLVLLIIVMSPGHTSNTYYPAAASRQSH